MLNWTGMGLHAVKLMLRNSTACDDGDDWANWFRTAI